MAKQFHDLKAIAELLCISGDQASVLVETGELEAISVHAPGASRRYVRVSDDALERFIVARSMAKRKYVEKASRTRRTSANSKSAHRWV